MSATGHRTQDEIRRDVLLTLAALGLQLDDHQLRAVLVALIAERRTAWRQGWHDAHQAVRQASNTIAAATNWNDETSQLDYMTTAAKYRARMLDPRPRPGDFAGRRPGDAA